MSFLHTTYVIRDYEGRTHKESQTKDVGDKGRHRTYRKGSCSHKYTPYTLRFAGSVFRKWKGWIGEVLLFLKPLFFELG